MIARTWHATATRAVAEDICHNFEAVVAPSLRTVEGHVGMIVLKRPLGDATEIVLMTLWDSMETIHRFGGADADAPNLDAAGRARLLTFDERVQHYEVAYHGERPGPISVPEEDPLG